MSSFWHWTVTIVVIAHIIAYCWLLFATAKKKTDKRADNTTGHVWDDDITELDNPMPRWWLWLFVATIIFSIIYLILYPGLGNYDGTKEWTQQGRFEANYQKVVDAREEIYAAFINKPVDEMIQDDTAMLLGQRIYANNCAQCHASDAQGGYGYPNLTDDNWKWGGEFDTIIQTISNGRTGIMTPWAGPLGEDGVKQVAAYVRSLSGIDHDAQLAESGAAKFQMFCVACHGPEGKGNQMLGAPDLTDDVWLYGSHEIIETALYEGLQGYMPPQNEVLDEHQIKLVAAYVYSLSRK